MRRACGDTNTPEVVENVVWWYQRSKDPDKSKVDTIWPRGVWLTRGEVKYGVTSGPATYAYPKPYDENDSPSQNKLKPWRQPLSQIDPCCKLKGQIAKTSLFPVPSYMRGSWPHTFRRGRFQILYLRGIWEFIWNIRVVSAIGVRRFTTVSPLYLVILAIPAGQNHLW